jgi:transposase
MGKFLNQTLKNREAKRAQIIALKKAGLSNKKISEQVGIHKSNVGRIWNRFKTAPTIHDAKRTGRPSILSARDKRHVVRILKKKEAKTGTEIVKKFNQKSPVKLSKNIVYRTLKEAGYVSRLKKKKPLLTKDHRKRRLEWAKEFQNFTIEHWKFVVWSDETKFNLVSSDGKEYYWTNTPGVLTPDSIKATKKYGGGSIMVWGCMTWQGLGICCKIEGNMTGELYSQILKEELISSLNYYNMNPSHIIFQHDNDPKHTSKLAKSTLEELDIEVMTWPAQSPDMNPIEHMWNHIERKLRKLNKHYQNKDDLWSDLDNILSKKYTSYCQKLIKTMPQRVIDLKKAKGFSTRW